MICSNERCINIHLLEVDSQYTSQSSHDKRRDGMLRTTNAESYAVSRQSGARFHNRAHRSLPFSNVGSANHRRVFRFPHYRTAAASVQNAVVALTSEIQQQEHDEERTLYLSIFSNILKISKAVNGLLDCRSL